MWCTAYKVKTRKTMVIYPEAFLNDKLEFTSFPITKKLQNYLNDKYNPLDGDIFIFPFVTSDFPVECFYRELTST